MLFGDSMFGRVFDNKVRIERERYFRKQRGRLYTLSSLTWLSHNSPSELYQTTRKFIEHSTFPIILIPEAEFPGCESLTASFPKNSPSDSFRAQDVDRFDPQESAYP